MNIANRPPPKSGSQRKVILFLIHQRLVPEAILFKTIPDPAIINAQEFCAASSHVNAERFALRPLLIQELVNRVILGP